MITRESIDVLKTTFRDDVCVFRLSSSPAATDPIECVTGAKTTGY